MLKQKKYVWRSCLDKQVRIKVRCQKEKEKTHRFLHIKVKDRREQHDFRSRDPGDFSREICGVPILHTWPKQELVSVDPFSMCDRKQIIKNRRPQCQGGRVRLMCCWGAGQTGGGFMGGNTHWDLILLLMCPQITNGTQKQASHPWWTRNKPVIHDGQWLTWSLARVLSSALREPKELLISSVKDSLFLEISGGEKKKWLYCFNCWVE